MIVALALQQVLLERASSRAFRTWKMALPLPAPASLLGSTPPSLTHFAAQAVIWRQRRWPELQGAGVILMLQNRKTEH